MKNLVLNSDMLNDYLEVSCLDYLTMKLLQRAAKNLLDISEIVPLDS